MLLKMKLFRGIVLPSSGQNTAVKISYNQLYYLFIKDSSLGLVEKNDHFDFYSAVTGLFYNTWKDDQKAIWSILD